MIRLLTGKTGAGKSYFGVALIFEALNNNKRVYTNIKLNIELDNYIYLDELGIKKYLEFVGTTFANVDNLEDKKIELQNTEYFESDFFIDEAHLVGFRDKKEAVLNWLTIHRHFNQNITVITQVPSNIHRDYLMLFHSHIDMIPPNKRLSKNSMGFKEYDAYKGDRIKTKYFKPIPEIFSSYNSGNIEKGINKDVFKLVSLAVGMVVLSFIAYNSISSFYDKDKFANRVPEHLRTAEQKSTLTSVSSSVDSNVTIEDKNASHGVAVVCSDYTGCYYGAMNYTLTQFKSFVLPKFKSATSETMAVVNKKDKIEVITKYVLLD